MRSVQFRKASRAITWLFLAWVGLDLGYPSLCALDQESQLPSVSAPTLAGGIDASSPVDRTPTRTMHIDDCFCCSHCVEAGVVSAPALLPRVDLRAPLPAGRLPFSTGHPPYHPPRA